MPGKSDTQVCVKLVAQPDPVVCAADANCSDTEVCAPVALADLSAKECVGAALLTCNSNDGSNTCGEGFRCDARITPEAFTTGVASIVRVAGKESRTHALFG